MRRNGLGYGLSVTGYGGTMGIGRGLHGGTRCRATALNLCDQRPRLYGAEAMAYCAYSAYRR